MMTKTFTYAEIFGGILGFGTAFDQLGGECVFVSELDKFAQQAITALGKGDVLHGDITEVKAEDIPQHDVLTAGFPCPAFSVAGSRGGMEYLCSDCSHEHLITFNEYVNGAKCPECGGHTEPKDIRGLLFFEVARVAQAKKPRVVLLENVKGLLSSSGGDVMRIITETLNSIGYTVDFELLNSKYFDVAQSRERVFITAFRDDIVEKVDWSDVKGTTAIPKAKRKLSESDSIKTFNFDWPEQTEVRTRLRDFLEDSVDERYYLSEDKTAALVKQLEEKAEGIAVKEATTKGYAVAAEGDAVNIQFPNSKTRRGRVGKQMANTIEASGVNQGVVERVEPIRIGGLYGNKQAGAVWDKDAISPAITTPSGGYSEPIITEEITMQMVGRADILGHDYNKRVYHEDGIGRYLNTASDIGRSLKVATKGEEGSRYRIRKLTPRECARLQSIPEDIIDVLLTHFSDSRVYKFCGNGLTTNVINAIGERLIKYL